MNINQFKIPHFHAIRSIWASIYNNNKISAPGTRKWPTDTCRPFACTRFSPHQIRSFEEWMQAKYFDPSMGPLMRTAIEYTFKRLPKLSMYVTNGSWYIDNNGVENAIRPLATGRKSYLFCGSDASDVRTSMIYSFTASCKVAGIEPREWFEDVIRRIPEYENGRSDVTHLLPKNWSRNSNDSNQR